MAWQQPGIVFSFAAGGNLASHQFRAVKVNSSGNIVAMTSYGATPGILQNNPSSGNEGSVMQNGVSKCAVNGAITAGGAIQIDFSSTSGVGRVIAATSATRGHNDGIALETSVTAGDIIACVINIRP